MKAIIEFDCLMRMESWEGARLGKAIREYAKFWSFTFKEIILKGGGVEYGCNSESDTIALCHFIHGYLIAMGFNLETWERKKG